ncbi:MAG: hypothetical protein M5U30_16455 [Burkholderiaceae bacterium]|nr:hypothetical protein [Burkholderiaceae bacterium]
MNESFDPGRAARAGWNEAFHAGQLSFAGDGRLTLARFLPLCAP